MIKPGLNRLSPVRRKTVSPNCRLLLGWCAPTAEFAGLRLIGAFKGDRFVQWCEFGGESITGSAINASAMSGMAPHWDVVLPSSNGGKNLPGRDLIKVL